MRKAPNRPLVCVFLVIVATLAVYRQAMDFHFLDYDDPDYVTENFHLRDGLTLPGVTWALTATRAANWHPLTWVSHMVDVEMYGLDPMGHHLTNILFHLANTLLLFLVLKMMTGRMWRSMFVAALFALHPLHVESVAWVSERKDVLSTFFWLATMIAYAGYARKGGVGRYALVLVVYALGLMSKPMLVTLPIVLILMDYWPLSQIPKHQISNIKSKLPLFALALASCVITFIAQRGGGATQTVESIGIGLRAANALVSYASYLVKMVFPSDLCIIYPHPGGDIAAWNVAVSAVFFVGMSYAAARAVRRFPYFTVGWLWYVITLIPVIGLVQVGPQAMADRYTYVPLIGIFIMIAWGIPDMVGSRLRGAATAVPAVIVLGAFAVGTWFQVGYWRDTETLFDHAVRCSDGHFAVRSYKAKFLLRQGRMDDAMAEFEAVLKLNPNHAEAHNGLGYILANRGDMSEAVRHYVRAIELNPNLADAHSNLGTAFARRGMLAQARECFEQAASLDTGHAESRYNLGHILLEQGDGEHAVKRFEEALRIDPAMASAHLKIGIIRFDEGDLPSAVESLGRAVELNPRLAEARLYLGAALFRQGELEDAIHHLDEAVSLAPKWGMAHKSLATALLKAGDKARAAKHMRLAEKYAENGL